MNQRLGWIKLARFNGRGKLGRILEIYGVNLRPRGGNWIVWTRGIFEERAKGWKLRMGEAKGEVVEKTAKQLHKEAIKAAKAKKFAEKQAKAGGSSKDKRVEGGEGTKRDKGKGGGGINEEWVDCTVAGQRKVLGSLEEEIHRAYIPRVVESSWYDWWEKEGFFKPEFLEDGRVKAEGYFVIAVPPPNVTGKLHCGHALANALQDCLIRWNRMKGKTTLFIPGCDHAGIATQAVVEKMLWRREKKSRHDIGREEFVKRVWQWKDEYRGEINRVFRRMGGSYDWSREAFTMDENLSKAVIETFVRLYEEGLIYRSNRLVNWDVSLATALSTLEVDTMELTGRTLLEVPGYDRKVEFGVLTYFKYEIEGNGGYIEVATTRPETMLGDTAIAVNPRDERYKKLIGKKVIHPFSEREIRIIGDEYVDMEFGSGAVKITPGHDGNDFEIGKRHKLEFINIFEEDGTLNENGGKFKGMKRFEARYKVVEELERIGLFVKKEDNAMKVPISSRSGDVIEPMMKPQWWMKMKGGLSEGVIEVVKRGDICIRPSSAEKSFFRWMEGIEDWCISRQLWWGHRIPAYRVKIGEGKGKGKEDGEEEEKWIVARNEEEARIKVAQEYGDKDMVIELERDEDVLDTWFSSGLWPVSTLGWPEQGRDFERLFPMSILETGWDILFFWVARMIMFSLKLTGKVPFSEVYCHSLIRDSQGRKMSKSLGNVIDPVDIMDGISLQGLNDKLSLGNLDPKELKCALKFQQTAFPRGIPECGSDALRFSLIHYTTGGGDISFDVQVMQAYRRFCNKIYQAVKYLLGKIGDNSPLDSGLPCTLPQAWILHLYSSTCRDVNLALTNREFAKSAQILHQFWHDHLCDVFIESSKFFLQHPNSPQRSSFLSTLYTCIEGGLRLIHPFMPFLSEELWQRLPRQSSSPKSIMIAPYPEYSSQLFNVQAFENFEIILSVVRALRSLMAEYHLLEHTSCFIQSFNDTYYNLLLDHQDCIKFLCGNKSIDHLTLLNQSSQTPQDCAVHVISSHLITFLHVKNQLNLETEIPKLKSKLESLSQAIHRQSTLINAPEFSNSASPSVQHLELQKLKNYEAEMINLQNSLAQFQKMSLDP